MFAPLRFVSFAIVFGLLHFIVLFLLQPPLAALQASLAATLADLPPPRLLGALLVIWLGTTLLAGLLGYRYFDSRLPTDETGTPVAASRGDGNLMRLAWRDGEYTGGVLGLLLLLVLTCLVVPVAEHALPSLGAGADALAAFVGPLALVPAVFAFETRRDAAEASNGVATRMAVYRRLRLPTTRLTALVVVPCFALAWVSIATYLHASFALVVWISVVHLVAASLAGSVAFDAGVRKAVLLARQPIETPEGDEPVPPPQWEWDPPATARTPLLLFAALVASVLGIGAAEWHALPARAELLQMGNALQANVERADNGQVQLVGNRFEYSIHTDLAALPRALTAGAVAVEDRRFFEPLHGAPYLVLRMAQAAVCDMQRVLQRSDDRCAGNSTIPQQLAKILLLSHHRTRERKVKELVLALRLMQQLERNEILELYLNRAYFGNGNHGVETAARDYFGKHASDLSPTESALLIGSLKNPSWNVRQNPTSAVRRARVVAALMVERGAADVLPSIRPLANWRRGPQSPRRPDLGYLWLHTRPSITRALESRPPGEYKVSLGADAEATIYAQVHLDAQVRSARRRSGQDVQGAVIMLARDGSILASVGGVGDDVAARGTHRGIAMPGRRCVQAASTLKLVTYLAALQSGLTAETMINARDVEVVNARGTRHRPRNHDGRRFERLSLGYAFADSTNTAAIRLFERVGYGNWRAVYDQLGLTGPPQRPRWSLALGVHEVCLNELAEAYRRVLIGRNAERAHDVLSVSDAGGDIVRVAPRRLAPGNAIARAPEMRALLRRVVQSGTGREAARGLVTELDVSGKTGTVDANTAALFIGWAGDVLIAVWIGTDHPAPIPELAGGQAPARVFNRIVHSLYSHTERLRPQTNTPPPAIGARRTAT